MSIKDNNNNNNKIKQNELLNKQSEMNEYKNVCTALYDHLKNYFGFF